MRIYSFLWVGELEAGEESSLFQESEYLPIDPGNQPSFPCLRIQKFLDFRKVIRHITEF